MPVRMPAIGLRSEPRIGIEPISNALTSTQQGDYQNPYPDGFVLVHCLYDARA